MAGGCLSLLISLGLWGDLEIIMVAVLSFPIHNLVEVRHKSVSLVIAICTLFCLVPNCFQILHIWMPCTVAIDFPFFIFFSLLCNYLFVAKPTYGSKQDPDGKNYEKRGRMRMIGKLQTYWHLTCLCCWVEKQFIECTQNPLQIDALSWYMAKMLTKIVMLRWNPL